MYVISQSIEAYCNQTLHAISLLLPTTSSMSQLLRPAAQVNTFSFYQIWCFCYDFVAHVLFWQLFSFTSTLADAMCSMDVSRSPDSLISYSRFPCHAQLAHALVCSRFACFLTCTNIDYRLVAGYLSVPPFPFPSRRFVRLRFALMSFSVYLVDSSLRLLLLLMPFLL